MISKSSGRPNEEPEQGHKDLLARLSVDQRRSLVSQSDWPALLRLTAHLGLIALPAAYVAYGWPFWQGLLVLQGVFLVFLFTTLHETIHFTAFRTNTLNRAVAYLCGFLVLLPPTHFRYFHLAHHRFTHDPQLDPELATPKPSTHWQYIKVLSGLPDLWSRLKGLAGNAFVESGASYIPPRARTRVLYETRVYLSLYALLTVGSIASGSAFVFWAWVIPSLLGQPFLRAYLLAEHANCPHVANMLLNTRTTFTTSLVRFLAWNMPYHIEHHTYPAVPFHNLPRFHTIARSLLGTTADGYIRFHADYLSRIAEPSQQDSGGKS